jgi:hypothetical protein
MKIVYKNSISIIIDKAVIITIVVLGDNIIGHD